MQGTRQGRLAMALCEQLEFQLVSSETDSHRLFETVLRDTLAPALEQAA